jgi:recombinational DNA repair protein (RecF pathway)
MPESQLQPPQQVGARMNIVPCIYCGTAVDERDTPRLSNHAVCVECFAGAYPEIDRCEELEPFDATDATQAAFLAMWDNR